MDRGVVYALFAREFGWTLRECLGMTRWQQFLYLDRLGRLNAFEKRALEDREDRPAVPKERAESYEEIAKALPLF